MATTMLWQHDCPGSVETEVVDGVIVVTCYVEEGSTPPTRVTEGLQVLYTFEEGSGVTVHDVSGAAEPLDLVVDSEAALTWRSEGGLSVDSPATFMSTAAATRVVDAAKASNEITIEAWVRPASAGQSGPARIVTLSADFHHRNFQLAQIGDLYDVRLRTSETTDNGRPSLSSPAGSLGVQLTHVVYTRTASGQARLYLDGSQIADMQIGGVLANWDQMYRLALANELTGSRSWLGEFHLVALYDRALTAEQVDQNLKAGTPSS